jgi:hypothetical protein
MDRREIVDPGAAQSKICRSVGRIGSKPSFRGIHGRRHAGFSVEQDSNTNRTNGEQFLERESNSDRTGVEHRADFAAAGEILSRRLRDGVLLLTYPGFAKPAPADTGQVPDSSRTNSGQEPNQYRIDAEQASTKMKNAILHPRCSTAVHPHFKIGQRPWYFRPGILGHWRLSPFFI